jgi:hypothetical protein
MADIFISYAKAERPLALKLAAMLEAEGWKTWWDTSLIPGDDFRNEIMTELGRARAVIVIWTDASIKSDWVRSEAGRAQADRKLIPVKLPAASTITAIKLTCLLKHRQWSSLSRACPRLPRQFR